MDAVRDNKIPDPRDIRPVACPFERAAVDERARELERAAAECPSSVTARWLRRRAGAVREVLDVA